MRVERTIGNSSSQHRNVFSSLATEGRTKEESTHTSAPHMRSLALAWGTLILYFPIPSSALGLRGPPCILPDRFPGQLLSLDLHNHRRLEGQRRGNPEVFHPFSASGVSVAMAVSSLWSWGRHADTHMYANTHSLFPTYKTQTRCNSKTFRTKINAINPPGSNLVRSRLFPIHPARPPVLYLLNSWLPGAHLCM